MSQDVVDEHSVVTLQHLGTSASSLRAQAFLALYSARPNALTYDEIVAWIAENSAKSIDPTQLRNQLRVAMAGLGRALERGHSSLRLVDEPLSGRLKQFRLVEGSVGSLQAPVGATSSSILVASGSGVDYQSVAEQLIRDRTLPFAAMYSLPSSSHWWATFSAPEVELRRSYEQESVDRFSVLKELDPLESNVRLNVVGLGVGEGSAERDILDMLRQKDRDVDYLAVETSRTLATSHHETIENAFANELGSTNRLRIASIQGDAFVLKDVVSTARAQYQQQGVSDFLASANPTLLTYFGNTIGTDRQDREWRILSSALEAFPGGCPLAMLIGFSVVRDQDDSYDRSWYDFLLRSPRSLTQEMGLIACSNKSEFRLNPPDGLVFRPEEHSFRLQVRDYLTPNDVRGKIYLFQYRLQGDIALTTNPEVVLHAGTYIDLCSIIKYDPNSLVRFIEARGLRVLHDFDRCLSVDTANGVRQYAVIAAVRTYPSREPG